MFGGTALFDSVLDQPLQSPKLCRREPELKLQGVDFDPQECEAGSGAFHFVGATGKRSEEHRGTAVSSKC